MRLLADNELADLAVDPIERVRRAVERGDDTTAERDAERARRAWARSIDGFRVWIVHMVTFLADRFGAEAAGTALGACTQAMAEWTPWPAPTATDRRAGATEPGSPVARLEAAAETARQEHDRWLDAVCVALSDVHREHGIEVLRDAVVHVGDQTLLSWMPEDIARDPVTRLHTWVRMLQGNWATVRVEEDDARFTIVQDPCGSCGRQLAAGRHPGPLGLSTVEEVHPITFDRGHVPVYRTHVAVMHYLVPEARVGVPWPVVECPRGLDAAPCRIRLYKDPLDPAARADAAAIRAP